MNAVDPAPAGAVTSGAPAARNSSVAAGASVPATMTSWVGRPAEIALNAAGSHCGNGENWKSVHAPVAFPGRPPLGPETRTASMPLALALIAGPGGTASHISGSPAWRGAGT